MAYLGARTRGDATLGCHCVCNNNGNIVCRRRLGWLLFFWRFEEPTTSAETSPHPGDPGEAEGAVDVNPPPPTEAYKVPLAVCAAMWTFKIACTLPHQPRQMDTEAATDTHFVPVRSKKKPNVGTFMVFSVIFVSKFVTKVFESVVPRQPPSIPIPGFHLKYKPITTAEMIMDCIMDYGDSENLILFCKRPIRGAPQSKHKFEKRLTAEAPPPAQCFAATMCFFYISQASPLQAEPFWAQVTSLPYVGIFIFTFVSAAHSSTYLGAPLWLEAVIRLKGAGRNQLPHVTTVSTSFVVIGWTGHSSLIFWHFQSSQPPLSKTQRRSPTVCFNDLFQVQWMHFFFFQAQLFLSFASPGQGPFSALHKG